MLHDANWEEVHFQGVCRRIKLLGSSFHSRRLSRDGPVGFRCSRPVVPQIEESEDSQRCRAPHLRVIVESANSERNLERPASTANARAALITQTLAASRWVFNLAKK